LGVAHAGNFGWHTVDHDGLGLVLGHGQDIEMLDDAAQRGGVDVVAATAGPAA
jgi:hypothetical protein